MLVYEGNRACVPERVPASHTWRVCPTFPPALQGYLAHTERLPPRTVQEAYAQRPVVVLGGLRFLISGVLLYIEIAHVGGSLEALRADWQAQN